MTTILAQQQQLLGEKLRVLRHVQSGLQWSIDRLPDLHATNLADPAVTERVAAIVERFRKLQDQLAGAMRHAHAMLGEKQRSFHDVVAWAVADGILASEATWLELRSLRNRLTHEYDLADDTLPELMTLIRQAAGTLASAIDTFAALCARRQLVSQA